MKLWAALQLWAADGGTGADGFGAAVAKAVGLQELLELKTDLFRHIGGSALTDKSIAVPDAEETEDISTRSGAEVPVTYVPFRNAHFLSAAVSWAEVLGAETVFIGAVEQDSSGYPDCRPAYYDGVQSAD